jgi:hypothetical protein
MRKSPVLILLAALLAAALFFASRTRSENPVPDDQAITEIVAAGVAALQGAYPVNDKGLVRRAAHAKPHGCVKAIFEVDPALPEDLRVGTFAQPGQRFKAVIRFSNSAFMPGPDAAPNGRGMAIKLIDADPDHADAARKNPPHDLLLINYPVYFLANIQDFLHFARAGAIMGDLAHARAYFLPGSNPFDWRLRELAIVVRNATRAIASPLRTDYFSMTPYAFGPGRAIKYAARPCAMTPAPAPDEKDPDYLRKALAGELKGGPACFELFAQQRTGDLPLDDATRDWPETQSPMGRLGRIDIPAQDVIATDREVFCENLSYNAAQAPEALAPLGGVNRARIELYRQASAFRFRRNGASPTDATKAWDLF